MRIIFFGTPYFVTPILQSLSEHFTVIGVVTAPDSIEGRKKILTPSPVKHFAMANGKSGEVFTPENIDTHFINSLKNLQPDLFVVAAYGKILSQEVLDIPKFGSVNIHPSLLPKYRGPSPIQSTIVDGETISGVSIIKMDEEVDHGPLIAQWEDEIKPDDTFESLHNRFFQQTAAKIPTIINDYVAGKIEPVEQDHDKATFCLKITREDGFVDTTKPVDPAILDRMVRAYFPWPTAWIRLHQDYGGQARTGAILKLLPGKKVQLEGKSVVTLKDFLNGYPRMEELIEEIEFI